MLLASAINNISLQFIKMQLQISATNDYQDELMTSEIFETKEECELKPFEFHKD